MGLALRHGAHLKNGHTGLITEVNWYFGHLAHGVGDFGEVFFGQIAGANVPAVHTRGLGYHAVNGLVVTHFKVKNEHCLTALAGGVVGEVLREG